MDKSLATKKALIKGNIWPNLLQQRFLFEYRTFSIQQLTNIYTCECKTKGTQGDSAISKAGLPVPISL